MNRHAWPVTESKRKPPTRGRSGTAWAVGCAFGAVTCTVAAWVVEVVALAVIVFGGHGPIWTLLLILLLTLVVLAGTPALFSYLFYRLYRRWVPAIPASDSPGIAVATTWPYHP